MPNRCLKCGCPPEIMSLFEDYEYNHPCGPCSDVKNDNKKTTYHALLTNKYATKCGKSAWHIHDPIGKLHINSLGITWE